MGKTVFIVAEVPEVGIAVPSFIARANYLGRDVAIDLPVADYNQRNADDTAMLQAIAKQYSIEILYPHELLCDDKICKVRQGDKPLYHDDDHLSVDGALFLEHMFDRVFTLPPSAGQRLGGPGCRLDPGPPVEATPCQSGRDGIARRNA